MEAGNVFLPEFKIDYNQRFALAPTSDEDAHRPVVHTAQELALVLCEHSVRTLSKNLTLQYRNTLYQLEHHGPGYHPRGAKVTVCELLNGQVVLLYRKRQLPYTIYRKAEGPRRVEDEKTLNNRVDAALLRQSTKPPPRPSPNHPWRQDSAVASARVAALAQSSVS